MKRLGTRLFALAAVVLGTIALSTCLASADTGAIWTTDLNCGSVDLNHYADKCDVYLNGGPSGKGSPGLPPGSYYVKIESPGGTLLGVSHDGTGMTTDTRAVVGANGRFVQCYQLCAILFKASDDSPGYDDTDNAGKEYKVTISLDPNFGGGSTKSDNFKVDAGGGPPQGCILTCPIGGLPDVPACASGGACSATVTFGPFSTTNDCGEVATGVPDHASGSSFPVGTTTVNVTFMDPEGNTATCPFNVVVSDCNKPDITCPGNKGPACLTAGGTTIDAGVATATAHCSSSTDGITITYDVVLPDGTHTAAIPGVFRCGVTTINATAINAYGSSSCSWTVTITGITITAHKFYDANANGLDDDGQPVQGVKMVLTADQAGMAVLDTEYTQANGDAVFPSTLCLPQGTYYVKEVSPGGTWVSTTPTQVAVIVGADSCSGSANFGNYCTTASLGLTLGFWTNRNGQAVLTGKDWAGLLNGLGCLRNVNGTLHTFSNANYTDLKNWLLNATATNMAYMLSAQLAANVLDGYNGLTGSTGIIVPANMKTQATACIVNVLSGQTLYATCGFPVSLTVFGAACGSGCGLLDGFTTVGALQAAAKCTLNANPNTTASGPARTYQECVKDLLDVINNKGNPAGSSAYPCGPGALVSISGTACAFTYPY